MASQQARQFPLPDAEKAELLFLPQKRHTIFLPADMPMRTFRRAQVDARWLLSASNASHHEGVDLLQSVEWRDIEAAMRALGETLEIGGGESRKHSKAAAAGLNQATTEIFAYGTNPSIHRMLISQNLDEPTA